jgi:hypothetical protein
MDVVRSGALEEAVLGLIALSSASTNCTDWAAALISFVSDGEVEFFKSL